MNDLNRYAELEKRRAELTDCIAFQKEEIAELYRKGKKKEALEMEKQYDKNLVELKSIMTELPIAKAAAERENIALEAETPTDVPSQQDNEIIYVSGEYALVLCADGTVSYTVQPEGTVVVGDMAFEADLKDFVELPEKIQNELITGYRLSRREV